MAGGVRLAVYFNLVPSLIKCEATLLLPCACTVRCLTNCKYGIAFWRVVENSMTARTGEIAWHNDWIQDLLLAIVIKGILYRKWYKWTNSALRELYKIINIALGRTLQQPVPHKSNTADNTSVTPTHSPTTFIYQCLDADVMTEEENFFDVLLNYFQRTRGYCKFTWWKRNLVV